MQTFLWFLIPVLLLAALFAWCLFLGTVLYLYAFYFAPRYLFGLNSITKPFIRQKPPPHLFKAFVREVFTGFLFFSCYFFYPFIKGINLKPGQGEVPVILVHGYIFSRASWFWFLRYLTQAKIRRPVYALKFSWLKPVEVSAVQLATAIEQILTAQNAEQVDIVAHSWGGFLARWYIQQLGMGARVRRLIMLSTPIQGSWSSRLGFGAPARELLVGSPTVELLLPAPSSPPYATLWTDCDANISPPQLSLLTERGHPPAFVQLFKGRGHLTMVRDREVAHVVVKLLEEPIADVSSGTES